MYYFKLVLWVSSNIYPEIELLDHMIIIFFNFEKLPYYFYTILHYL